MGKLWVKKCGESRLINVRVTQSVFRAGPVKLYEYQQIKIIFLTFRSNVGMYINILV